MLPPDFAASLSSALDDDPHVTRRNLNTSPRGYDMNLPVSSNVQRVIVPNNYYSPPSTTGIKRRRTLTTSACGPDLERALQTMIEERLDGTYAVVHTRLETASPASRSRSQSPQPGPSRTQSLPQTISPPLSQAERQSRERLQSLRPRPEQQTTSQTQKNKKRRR